MYKSIPGSPFLLGLSLMGSLLAACDRRADTIVLQREWTANAEFAGDVWASKIAPKFGIRLDVHEGSETVDPVKMVRSGTADFGVASADRVLRENDSGANLVVLGTASYKSPVVFLTKSGIDTSDPRSLKDRTVGLQSGTNTELVFYALARELGLKLDELRVVESGWGTQTFEVGTIDVLGAFAYDEPVSLNLKGVKFGKILPEDHGVSYVGTVYFTRRELINTKPELVQSFVSALVEGWRNTLGDMPQAMRILSEKYESVRSNAEKEEKSLAAGREYFAGETGRLLYASRDRWEAMAKSLIALGKLKTFSFDASVDYRFLDKAATR